VDGANACEICGAGPGAGAGAGADAGGIVRRIPTPHEADPAAVARIINAAAEGDRDELVALNAEVGLALQACGAESAAGRVFQIDKDLAKMKEQIVEKEKAQLKWEADQKKQVIASSKAKKEVAVAAPKNAGKSANEAAAADAAAQAVQAAKWEEERQAMEVANAASDANWKNASTAATHPQIYIRYRNLKGVLVDQSIARGDGDCAFWSVLSGMRLLEGEGARGHYITDVAKILLGRDAKPPGTLDELKQMVQEIIAVMQCILVNHRRVKFGTFGGIEVGDRGMVEYQHQMTALSYNNIEGQTMFQAMAILYGVGIKVYNFVYHMEETVKTDDQPSDSMVYVSTGEGHYNLHAATSRPSPNQLDRVRSSGWIEQSYGTVNFPELANAIKSKQYKIVRPVMN
jgi:hypothetical protein